MLEEFLQRQDIADEYRFQQDGHLYTLCAVCESFLMNSFCRHMQLFMNNIEQMKNIYKREETPLTNEDREDEGDYKDDDVYGNWNKILYMFMFMLFESSGFQQ